MKTEDAAAPLPAIYRLYTIGAMIATPLLDRMTRRKLQRAGLPRKRQR